LSSPPGGPRTASSELSKISAQLAPSFSPADLGALGVEHRASVIESEDPFTTLGLPRGASVDAVRASYFRLAKLWHPDRLPAELAPFRREVEKVFEHMTRAHRTLTETDARREYLATGKRASSASGPPDKRPRPEVIREIEQAIAKREFHLAESTARQLVTANAEDCEAQALAAWASTSAGDGAEETLRAALPLLDRAVNGDRHCERALFYRGVVHKRLGNSAGAFRDFARVVHLNPKHVDAQREVRIFEMRARKGSGEHVLDALISKVKKK
jgi:curved DNA-binding protein CbpA